MPPFDENGLLAHKRKRAKVFLADTANMRNEGQLEGCMKWRPSLQMDTEEKISQNKHEKLFKTLFQLQLIAIEQIILQKKVKYPQIIDFLKKKIYASCIYGTIKKIFKNELINFMEEIKNSRNSRSSKALCN